MSCSSHSLLASQKTQLLLVTCTNTKFFSRWKILIWPVHVQDLSLGVEGARLHQAAGAEGIVRGARRGVECLSLLPNCAHGKPLLFSFSDRRYLFLRLRYRWVVAALLGNETAYQISIAVIEHSIF